MLHKPKAAAPDPDEATAAAQTIDRRGFLADRFRGVRGRAPD